MAGGYKNFAAGAVLTEADVDDYLMRQTVMVFASAAARDAAVSGVVVEGMCAYLTDTNKLTTYDGSSWWTTGYAGNATLSHTPGLVQGVTVAKTVTVSAYRVVDGICDWWFKLDITGTGTGGSIVVVTLPVDAAAIDFIAGPGSGYDVSTPFLYMGEWEIASTTAATLRVHAGTSDLYGATPNVALASGDILRGTLRYPVATAA